jgi:hypothetical protein
VRPYHAGERARLDGDDEEANYYPDCHERKFGEPAEWV